MASETADAPPVAPSAPKTTAPDLFATEIGRANSLKRPRGTTPTSPNTIPGGLSHPELSPAKLARLGDSTRFTPAPALTGQAAREDEDRRREEEARLHPPRAVTGNPAQQALAALRGAEAMSRANEEPAAAQPSADVAGIKADRPAVIPPAAGITAENPAGTSPHSATSVQSLGDGLAVVHSPAPMDIDSRNERAGYIQPDAQMQDKAVSMSYPGIAPPGGSMPAPPRGMSLPMSNSQNPDIAPRSPSSKKHKCPYCETEFTRHHNLKSHLLTHSQEKPYICQSCQMRFRRLHDLKRHSKLHTGEKPHICPKCERRFARGDALARHSKGSGGCAGRRSSMGSFAGDDDYEGGSAEADDSAMTGVIYDGNGNDSGMTEEERRRLSLPSIKAQLAAGQPASEAYQPQSRTYPPAGPRAGTAGGLYPPNIERIPIASASTSSTSPTLPTSTSSGHTPSTSISSARMSAASGGSASLYSHGMTESPKPLSPGALQPNQPGHDSANRLGPRSPSLTTHLQQKQIGRRQSELTSPSSTTPTAPPANMAPAPSQPPNIAGLHSRASSGPSAGQSGGSGDSSANLFTSEHGIWTFIQNLEQRVSQQAEKMRSQEERIMELETIKHNHEQQIAYLTTDFNAFRATIATARAQSQEGQEQPAPKN